MIVRLNTLLKGYSGISEELAEHLAKFINKKILPVIPEHGAVGTSGDLVQLAHIALALIGEGEVWYEGKRVATKQVLKKLNIAPYVLKPKEGLSLINGTSVMTGILALLVIQSQKVVEIAIRTGAWALEAVEGARDSIDPVLHEVRPHPGQIYVAKTMFSILRSSHRIVERKHLQKRYTLGDDVQSLPKSFQEVYSLRCTPQILGPIYDTVMQAHRTVSIEMNSVTDNPIVDVKNSNFIHGGNFHGDYIAVAADHLKQGLVKLTILTERRVNFFFSNHINLTFPPFLNVAKPGLTLSLQALQFVATSTTAQSQSLAYPHSLHSISTNADNQDVVSMGTDAALMAAKVLDNAFILLTIELATLAQATDCVASKNGQKTRDDFSKEIRGLYTVVRKIMPTVIEDRPISPELALLQREITDPNFSLQQ
jgi:histidine ammonia-lyase